MLSTRGALASAGRRLRLILVVFALVVGSAPFAWAAAPLPDVGPCSGEELDELTCGASAGGIVLHVFADCPEAIPGCDAPSWYLEATSCADVEGPLVLEWEFVLSDVPAFTIVAQSEPTGDPTCPHRAWIREPHSGGTFHLPTECVRASAASPGGAASAAKCRDS